MTRFLTLALVMTSLCAYPQTDTRPNGDISGIVTDQNGTPVAAATVYAVPQDITFDGITPRSIITGKNGEFHFRAAFQARSVQALVAKGCRCVP